MAKSTSQNVPYSTIAISGGVTYPKNREIFSMPGFLYNPVSSHNSCRDSEVAIYES